MTYQEILTRAINEYYNNPGTATSLFTPTMVVHWIDKHVRRYFKLICNNEFGYFSFREKVLDVLSSANVYALPNGNPSNDDTDNVAYVTAIAAREGSSPNYRYTLLGTIFPTDKYTTAQNQFSPWYLSLSSATFSKYPKWSFEKGLQDADTFPTNYIRFTPYPSQNFTAVYDGVRMPYLGDEDDLSVIPDLPEYFHDGLVLGVLREAYVRAKIDTSGLDRDIAKFDSEVLSLEDRSIQRQGSNIIKRVN